MRVGVVTSYFPSSAQPWQGRTAYQTLRLLAAEPDIDLRVFYMESRYPAGLTPRSRTFPALDAAWQPEGVAVDYIPYPVLPLVSRPLNGFFAARALLARVRSWRPDVLLSYIIYPDGDAALRLARLLHLPLVATAIGSDLNRISDALSGRRTRRVLREARRVITVSGDLRRTALRLGAPADRTEAVLNGTDEQIFFPRDRAEARQHLSLGTTGGEGGGTTPSVEPEIILYIGRMDLAKGLGELVEAVAALRKRRPAIHAYLVGHGPDEPQIRQSIREHNADSFLSILPACPPDQVAWWIAAADLVTLPSYREGCPNVVVEALACGRPVVATDVGGIPELLDTSSGALVPARDSRALELALEDTLARTWNPETISARHRRSWHDVAHDVRRILEAAWRSSGGRQGDARTGAH